MTVVKVLRFHDGEPSVPGRPTRVAVGEALALDGLPPPRFAAVDALWFTDVDGALAAVAACGAAGGCVVVAEELVLRGRDYLDARWAAGGERYKMLSAARRHPRLTPAEFSARWRAEAGRLGSERIPEDVRGLAYVQNHPVPVEGREWPLDAINEVWFDRLDDLRRRAEWLAERRVDAGGIFSPDDTWSLLVREVAA